eukprot:9061722-Pyramimonas_sp.AAC.1
MQGRSEGCTWVRSTRGQFRSFRLHEGQTSKTLVTNVTNVVNYGGAGGGRTALMTTTTLLTTCFMLERALLSACFVAGAARPRMSARTSASVHPSSWSTSTAT